MGTRRISHISACAMTTPSTTVTAEATLETTTLQYHALPRPSMLDLNLVNDNESQALVLYSVKAAETGLNPWLTAPVITQSCKGGCKTHHWSAVHSNGHPLMWTVTRHYHYAMHILRLRGKALDTYVHRSLSLKQREQFVTIYMFIKTTYMHRQKKPFTPYKRMRCMIDASALLSSGLCNLRPSLLNEPLQPPHATHVGPSATCPVEQ